MIQLFWFISNYVSANYFPVLGFRSILRYTNPFCDCNLIWGCFTFDVKVQITQWLIHSYLNQWINSVTLEHCWDTRALLDSSDTVSWPYTWDTLKYHISLGISYWTYKINLREVSSIPTLWTWVSFKSEILNELKDEAESTLNMHDHSTQGNIKTFSCLKCWYHNFKSVVDISNIYLALLLILTFVSSICSTCMGPSPYNPIISAGFAITTNIHILVEYIRFLLSPQLNKLVWTKITLYK